jgi:hypothetical protein
MYLFLLPHPDDEFFILPYINFLKSNNYLIKIIYFTNGVYKNHSSTEREMETISVLEKFNILNEDIFFFGRLNNINDANIINSHGSIINFLNSYIFLNYHNINKIILPAWEGGHHDHDALNMIVQYTCKKYNYDISIYQFYLYNCYNIIYPFYRVMYPLTNINLIYINITLLETIKVILCAFKYKSQWRTFLGLLPFAAISLLTRRGMYIQRCDFELTNERPHKGLLLYERRKRFNYLSLKKLRDLLH